MSATSRQQYLTEHEAASHLRISIRSMQRWRQEGVGPRFHKAGRRVLYTAEDLESWLGAGARTSTSELPGVA
jgi:predicted site-specific integrase-resolvase